MHSVVELPTFLAAAEKLFSPEEKDEVIALLASDPLAGDLIPGTGGVRKLRVPASGRGKRGGARVIYYVLDDDAPIFALMAFAKNRAEDMTSTEKASVTRIAAAIKSSYRRTRH